LRINILTAMLLSVECDQSAR